MHKDIYTVKDIAEQLQVTEKSVRRLIASGDLKAKKAIGKWVVTAENFKEFFTEKGGVNGCTKQ